MKQPATEIKYSSLSIGLICAGFILLCAILQFSNASHWASLAIEASKNGQYWRLLSGHLVHADWQHYGMNMLGLSLCMVVYRQDLAPVHWITSFVFIALFSSLCMLYFYSNYHQYLGFSDVLHGWILLGAFTIFTKEPVLAISVFVLFWLKVLFENMDMPFFTSTGVTGAVATESHLYGAIGGMLYAILFLKPFKKAINT